MPKVFHLIKSLGRGGAEKLLIETLRCSEGGRYELEFGYFLSWKDQIARELVERGAPVTCFDRGSNAGILMSAKRVADHVVHQRVDILHCHLPIAGVVGRLAGKLSGVPVVYTEHNKLERYHPLTRRANALTWRMQKLAIAVSREVADSISAYSRNGTPVRVIHNGVDTEWFDVRNAERDRVRDELSIPRFATVVGSVAVFRSQKRLQDWLAAACMLADQHDDLHFLLVGDGPERQAILDLSKAMGLEGLLHLPGLQTDVRSHLAAMDVFMISSIFEGLPVALLEAMSMQCAVVSTRVGGIPEVIQPGQNGLLTAPLTPEALARAVSELLDDPARRSTLGANARRTVVERFGLERMTRELESAYDAVLANE